METLTNYIIPILEFIVLLADLFLLFNPSEPTTSIKIGDNYTFNTYYQTSDNQNNRNEGLILGISLILCYILYATLNKLLIPIIMLLALLKMLRYRILNIDYRNELLIPTLTSIMLFTFKFLPQNITEYWENSHKINFSDFKNSSTLFDSISKSLNEIIQIFFNVTTDLTKSLSIIGITIIVYFSFYDPFLGLLTPKHSLKAKTTIETHSIIIGLLILYGLAFYHISWNPIKILIEGLINFFSN